MQKSVNVVRRKDYAGLFQRSTFNFSCNILRNNLPESRVAFVSFAFRSKIYDNFTSGFSNTYVHVTPILIIIHDYVIVIFISGLHTPHIFGVIAVATFAYLR